jgi:hypothetical protein
MGKRYRVSQVLFGFAPKLRCPEADCAHDGERQMVALWNGTISMGC